MNYISSFPDTTYRKSCLKTKKEKNRNSKTEEKTMKL